MQETVSLPAPAASEVQVAVRATGLCGSDLHYYMHGRNGDIVVREPLALGHESAGVVTAVGRDVTSLQPGDRVALEVGVPCDACGLCLAGRYNLCRDMRFRSSAKSFPHFQGTLQERINHPARRCWHLPDELSLDHGALLEPLSVAVHALDRANVKDGNAHTALIWGAGAVGALVAAALTFDCPGLHVVVADVDEGRLKFARENNFGQASFQVPLKRGKDIEEKLQIAAENADMAKDILRESLPRTNGHTPHVDGYDIVFECTGQEICLQSSIFTAKPGSKVMMIGMGTPVQTLPVSAAALREVDLVGVFRYSNTYPRCTEMVQKAVQDINAGKPVPDITKLITHRYTGLHEVSKAFETASRPIDQDGRPVLKVVIEI